MKKGLLFIIAVATVLSAGSLLADTLGYTNSITLNNDVDATISLSKFDPSLGTLTSVYVEYWTTISGANVQMDNDSSQAQNGTARVQNQVNGFSSTAELHGIVTGTDLQINASQVFNLGPTSGDTVGQFDVTGLGDYDTWSPGALNGTGSGYILSIDYADYTGTGTYDVTVNATYTTSASFDGSDGYFQGNTPNGLFSGKVIYTYDPIPEPATIPLLAAVVAGAVWLRRRFVD